MKQRKTQTPEFWQEQFQISPNDVETISNQIIDKNRVFSLDEMSFFMVQQVCAAEERRMIELQDGKRYQPKEHYEVDEQVFFPHLDFAVGTVKHVREGNHPNYDQFSVIGITFKVGGRIREFVADFDYDHNVDIRHDGGLADMEGFMSPEELYQTYQPIVQNKVKATFDNHEDFSQFQDNYYLKDLLPEFQEGLFNIADAAIDIHGKPLAIDTLVTEMSLLDNGQATDINRFMVNCQLAVDDRFADVGPTGQVLWYLTRLQPNLTILPPWLASDNAEDYDVSILDEALQDILADIDDELVHPDDMSTVDEGVKEVMISLVYSHWRAGSLPVTAKTRSFFPQSSYNPVLIEFIDGRTGDSFFGWVLQEENYVLGLEEWYKKHALPVGTFITLQESIDDPTKIIIDYQHVRSQRDWVRQATVSNNRLSFKMNTDAIGCKYDELMMIGLDNVGKIDTLWSKAQDRKLSAYDVLCKVFLELSKLSPQSTVHVKTLYTAVNILRRTSPGLIFQELVDRPEFVGMKHGYWSYESKTKS